MPTIGDMYTKDVEVLGAPRHVEIDDTAGQVRATQATCAEKMWDAAKHSHLSPPRASPTRRKHTRTSRRRR
jgi:hypothetical protein